MSSSTKVSNESAISDADFRRGNFCLRIASVENQQFDDRPHIGSVQLTCR
jgi:hypothetical protein